MTDEDKKADVWMPIWIGAYTADTMALTTLQHGAYFLLLLSYWRNRGPLADDDDDLRSIAKMDRAEWKRARPKLAAFFRVGDGVWWHKRVEAELKEAEKRKAAAVAKAVKGAKARWGNGPSNGPANAPSMPEALPGDVPKQCPTPSPLPLPSGDSVPNGTGPAVADRSVDKSTPEPDDRAESKRILRQDAKDWLLSNGVTPGDAQVCLNTIAADHKPVAEAALREAIRIAHPPKEARSYLYAIVHRLEGEAKAAAAPAARAERAVEATQERLRQQAERTPDPAPEAVRERLAAARAALAASAGLAPKPADAPAEPEGAPA